MITFNLKTGVRIGPPLTLAEQRIRNPECRGRVLAQQERTPRGHILRAAEVIGLARMGQNDKIKIIDVQRPRRPQTAQSVENIVKIDETGLEILPAGTYPIFNGSSSTVPLPQVILPGAVRLLPVTIGLLENFAHYGVAHLILENQFNRGRPTTDLVRYIDLGSALKMVAIMNQFISSPNRLRVPTEALVAALYTAAPERLAQRLVLTASEYSEWGINPEELAIELSGLVVKPTTNFAYHFSFRDPATGRLVPGRYGAPLDSGLNTSLWLEIVSK